MKKYLLLKTLVGMSSLLLALSNLSMASDSFKVKPMNKRENPGFYQVVPGEIIVKFKSGVAEGDINAINKGLGAKIKKESYKKGKFKVLKFNSNKSIDKMIASYKRNNKVEYATANLICSAQFTPSDPLYKYQWNFQNGKYGGINMESAWDLMPGDTNTVVVAVLDTGVRSYLSDFSTTTFSEGEDFINNDSDPDDDNGHGTHVAGTIAQSTNNQDTEGYIGVAGIAYNTTIMPVKVLDMVGSGSTESLANGLYWATANGADIVNMSLSFPPGVTFEQIPALTAAVQDAYSNGVTIIAAAGNDGIGIVNYPALYPEVIAVGATTYNEKLASYSNYGVGLDITAPGGDTSKDLNRDGFGDGILQQTFDPLTNTAGYWFFQGTSMASPHVAGVAALIIAKNGDIGPDQVREILLTSALDIGISYGPGLVDASASLQDEIAPPDVNQQPVADPGGEYYSEDGSVSFDGAGSADPDGDALEFEWDFGDGGATGNGETTSHEYSQTGTYTVTLTVYDGEVFSDPATTTANVILPNEEPPALPLDCTDFLEDEDTCVSYPEECRWHPRKGCLNRN